VRPNITMRMVALISALLSVCASMASAQQVSEQPPQRRQIPQSDRLLIGTYSGNVKLWPVEWQVTAIDADGYPSGYITNYPDPGAMVQYEPNRRSFRTHTGTDGFPETRFPTGSMYTTIRRCGDDVCARFVFRRGGYTQKETAGDWWADVRFIQKR
jgi:hypothetical protein